ncbi:MAG TPA: GDSL-type esterase/lipase family protein [Azospirillaceae bacterium]|nr:GDSL-type esterase/lipase family protein [Azospirillaceae bacterium]
MAGAVFGAMLLATLVPDGTLPGTGAPPHAQEVPAPCAVPPEMQGLPGALPRTLERIRAGRAVRILAIGSSSTVGVGASTPTRAYPPRLETALEARFPDIDFTVRNDGIVGEAAAATLKRLKRDVVDWEPDLVIWQVGTNDALNDVPLDDFADTVRRGVQWTGDRGVDIVLMDPQYYPDVPHEDVYTAFVDAIGHIVAETGVPLLPRYRIMRHWASQPRDMPVLSGDGLHMNGAGYQCIAELLADGILERSKQAE